MGETIISSQQPALDNRRSQKSSSQSRYNHLSKEDLIALLQQRDATRKLGLVWERNEIEHENALNDDFVTLSVGARLNLTTCAR